MSYGRSLRRRTAAGLDQLDLNKARAAGLVDAYRCGTCHTGHVTVQVDRGVAPQEIPCPGQRTPHGLKNCSGTAKSLGHPKWVRRLQPGLELYMPKGPEAKAIYDNDPAGAERLRRAELSVRPRRLRTATVGAR